VFWNGFKDKAKEYVPANERPSPPDDPGELIDIYDDRFQKIGTKERVQAHRDGDWHRTFHCWIVYRDAATGQDFMVVQRRGPDKDLFPNLLDITAGGHYAAGETVRAGLREVQEELGIAVDFERLIPLGVRLDVAVDGPVVNREISDVFLLIDNRDISAYPFRREEISALVVFSIDEAIAMCAGERPTIPARAVIATPESDNLIEEWITVSMQDLVPSYDRYFYKILVLARRCLNGEKHLII
jgi:isopentenyldiphosphate isomerase